MIYICSYANSLLQSELKRLQFLSHLVGLCVYQIQASLLGISITFVKTLHLKLVVMFVHFSIVSSVINLIYSEQHVSL
jgi:hypothetical protein